MSDLKESKFYYCKTGWLLLCFDMMEDYIPKGCDSQETVDLFKTISFHAEILTEHYFKRNKNTDLVIRAANLFEKIGEYYEDCGMYDFVLKNYLRALEIKKSMYGEYHPEVAILYDNIGLFNTRAGNFDEAIDFHNIAIDIFESVYKEKHLDTAIAYSNLGLAFEELGKYDCAIEWYEKSKRIDEEILGLESDRKSVV